MTNYQSVFIQLKNLSYMESVCIICTKLRNLKSKFYKKTLIKKH